VCEVALRYVGVKVEKWKTLKISSFGKKEWLEICAIFSKDGVEEMMKSLLV
jgi:hypothetical protein